MAPSGLAAQSGSPPLLVLEAEGARPLSEDDRTLLAGSSQKEAEAWGAKAGLTFASLPSGFLLFDENPLGLISLKRRAWTMSLLHRGVRTVDLAAEGEEGRRTLAQFAAMEPQDSSAIRAASLKAEMKVEVLYKFRRANGVLVRGGAPLSITDHQRTPILSRQKVLPYSGPGNEMVTPFPNQEPDTRFREEFLRAPLALQQAKVRREAAAEIEKRVITAHQEFAIAQSKCMALLPPVVRKLIESALHQGPLKLADLKDDEWRHLKLALDLSGHSEEDLDGLTLTSGSVMAYFVLKLDLPGGREANLTVGESIGP